MADHGPIHATTVSFEGRGIVLLGPSGSGKSALALDLLALEADLVSDDITWLQRQRDTVTASAPKDASAAIEARFVGLLRASLSGPVPVALVIDMGQAETERLPPPRTWSLLGVPFPCLHKVAQRHFPAAVAQYIRHGRLE
ncbi:MAG: serine kinase [Alphaproteobacteria bacterium]|nr:serine kinase [Alphaproteobacteria bacterium]